MVKGGKQDFPELLFESLMVRLIPLAEEKSPPPEGEGPLKGINGIFELIRMGLT